jgi:hypothetical protein
MSLDAQFFRAVLRRVIDDERGPCGSGMRVAAHEVFQIMKRDPRSLKLDCLELR